MPADFDVLQQGAVLTKNSVQLPGDQHSTAVLTFRHKRGAAAAGKTFHVSTSCPMMVGPVDGRLDANGQVVLTVGPSFGLKGDATFTVKVDVQSVSLDVRFS